MNTKLSVVLLFVVSAQAWGMGTSESPTTQLSAPSLTSSLSSAALEGAYVNCLPEDRTPVIATVLFSSENSQPLMSPSVAPEGAYAQSLQKYVTIAAKQVILPESEHVIGVSANVVPDDDYVVVTPTQSARSEDEYVVVTSKTVPSDEKIECDGLLVYPRNLMRLRKLLQQGAKSSVAVPTDDIEMKELSKMAPQSR